MGVPDVRPRPVMTRPPDNLPLALARALAASLACWALIYVIVVAIRQAVGT